MLIFAEYHSLFWFQEINWFYLNRVFLFHTHYFFFVPFNPRLMGFSFFATGKEPSCSSELYQFLRSAAWQCWPRSPVLLSSVWELSGSTYTSQRVFARPPKKWTARLWSSPAVRPASARKPPGILPLAEPRSSWLVEISRRPIKSKVKNYYYQIYRN